MFKQKPFPFSLLVLMILIILHWVGSHFSLYWRFSWFEIIIHILSGLWVGLIILWLSSILGQINSLKEYRVKSFLIAFLSAIFIGVVWELIENFAQITFINDKGYGLNTAFDILNDGLGGIIAYLYFIKRRKCLDNTSDILHPFYNQTGIIKS